MNQFQYTIAMTKLASLKTKKSKVEFIRDLQSQIAPATRWGASTYPVSKDIEELSNQFRCLTKALEDDRLHNLPLFIGSTRDSLEDVIFTKCLEANSSKAFVAMTFENVEVSKPIDLMEFSSLLRSSLQGYHSASERVHLLNAIRDYNESTKSL